jgi:hypothetical protein
MKFPVCNGDLPAGGRLTLQIDCDQKNRGSPPEKDKRDTLIEPAGSSADPRGRDSAAVFAGTG